MRFKEHDHHYDLLNEFYHLNKYVMTEQFKDAVLDAIECLKKQKPQNVIKVEYGYKCPQCNAFWATYGGNFIDTNFCPNCGQRIKWKQ